MGRVLAYLRRWGRATPGRVVTAPEQPNQNILTRLRKLDAEGREIDRLIASVRALRVETASLQQSTAAARARAAALVVR
jgi:hypothetical protein